MINCQNCQELLPEFSLGELDGNDLRKVKFHLNKCRKCASEAAEYRRIWNLIPYTLDPVEPSADIKVQLMDRVKSSPRADKRKRQKNRRREQERSPFTFNLNRKQKWYAIAATLLACLVGLNSLRWSEEDPTDRLFADQQIKQRVVRLADSFNGNVPLIGEDGMPNFVYVSMRPGDGYQTLSFHPSAYAIWNRKNDKWHLFVEEQDLQHGGRDYDLLLHDAKGSLVASTSFSTKSLGPSGVSFSATTDRPIVSAMVALQMGPAPSSRQASIRTVVFEANLITPMVPVAVE
jgi:hypothetical protein